MENDLLLFYENVLINEKEDVTIELELEEMLNKFKSVKIQIKFKDKLLKEDVFKLKKEEK